MTLSRNLHPCRHDFVDLTAHGITEAETLAGSGRLSGSELILSSPYTRALQTAAILSRRMDLPLMVEYDLHERLPDTTFTVSDFDTLFSLCAEWEKKKGTPDGLRPWEPLDSIRERVIGVLKGYRRYAEITVVFHELALRSIVGVSERVPHCGVRTVTSADLGF